MLVGMMKKLLITDSKNRRLIYYDYQLKKYIEFSSELFNNNFDKRIGYSQLY